MTQVFHSASQIPESFQTQTIEPMEEPIGVLMCPPTYFNVVDVKNEFMASQVGRVDRERAARQWTALKTEFERAGLVVKVIAPTPGCEDMVFCANQTFIGVVAGRKVCVPSRMRYESRRREVPAFEKWFAENGYEIKHFQNHEGYRSEGGGDILWHPGRRLIWGGIGPRTDGSVFESLTRWFEAPLFPLRLVTTRFYHLDTCFAALDENTVMIYPPAFEASGLGLIKKFFRDVIVVDVDEAEKNMACNAAGFSGKRVFLQKGSHRLVRELSRRGFRVYEVDTSEFMKSGGSVFCMKMALY